MVKNCVYFDLKDENLKQAQRTDSNFEKTSASFSETCTRIFNSPLFHLIQTLYERLGTNTKDVNVLRIYNSIDWKK